MGVLPIRRQRSLSSQDRREEIQQGVSLNLERRSEERRGSISDPILGFQIMVRSRVRTLEVIVRQYWPW
jgi:hypothetical protein